MLKDTRNNLAVLFAAVLVIVGAAYLPVSASATSQTVCVLQPIDQSVPSHVVNMTMKVLAEHNETSRYVGLIEELTNKTHPGCDDVIQFQRAVNSNYNWVDKTAHYAISGNTLTLYTDKTPVLSNDGVGGRSAPGVATSVAVGSNKGQGGSVIVPQMTNMACLSEALATRQLTATGFAGYTTCNPYSGTETTTDKVPFYVVHKSLEQALEKMHL